MNQPRAEGAVCRWLARLVRPPQQLTACLDARSSQPFSTRADGQRSAAGSSTGSATALSSHNCLDIALGTDTGGSCVGLPSRPGRPRSIRVPAALMGLYGIRPTLGTLTTEGVLPLIKERDTLGYVCGIATD